TDGYGFINALLKEFPAVDFNNYHLVVFGAGDTAKSILHALLNRWMPLSLTLINRTAARAIALKDFLFIEQPGPTISVLPWKERQAFIRPNERCAVLQTTSIAGSDHATKFMFPWQEA